MATVRYLVRDVERAEACYVEQLGFVVEPFGAHPSYVQGAYDRDNRFYLDWDPISRDEAATQAWLAAWVHGVAGRAEYIEKLGSERLTRLRPSAPAPSGSVNYGEYR